MPLWQRLLLTVAAVILAGLLAGQLWHGLFGLRLPGYLGGIIGGLVALPVWEFLRRVGPRR